MAAVVVIPRTFVVSAAGSPGMSGRQIGERNFAASVVDYSNAAIAIKKYLFWLTAWARELWMGRSRMFSLLSNHAARRFQISRDGFVVSLGARSHVMCLTFRDNNTQIFIVLHLKVLIARKMNVDVSRLDCFQLSARTHPQTEANGSRHINSSAV